MSAINQKEIIAKEVNTLKPFGSGYAPISIGCPSRTHFANRDVFKKTMDEKWKLHNFKKECVKKPLDLIGRYQF